MPFLALLVLLVAPMAWAANIQYEPLTGNVTGVSDAAIEPVADRAVVSVAEPAASVAWPVPAGCPSGQWEWTRVASATPVVLEVRPAYVGFFFTSTSAAASGCYLVLSWPDLRRLYQELFVAYTIAGEFTESLNRLQGWVYGLCPESSGSANCVTSRSNFQTLASDYPGSGQLVTATAELLQLRNDRDAFKAAKGW